jgi:uncharacterized protein involved in high-affinity Fe2+ transport
MSELSLVLKGNEVFDESNNRIGFVTSTKLAQDHPMVARYDMGNGTPIMFQQGAPTYKLNLEIVINRPDLLVVHPGERKEIGEASKPTKARKIRI